MDWQEMQDLPDSRNNETLWFQVDSETVKGTFLQYPDADAWSELETVY